MSVASAVAVAQYTANNDFYWSASHTPLQLFQSGSGASGTLVRSAATLVVPCGPAIIQWGGSSEYRTNSFTLWTVNGANDTDSPDGLWHVYTPLPGIASQSVWLTQPGDEDDAIVKILPVAPSRSPLVRNSGQPWSKGPASSDSIEATRVPTRALHHRINSKRERITQQWPSGSQGAGNVADRKAVTNWAPTGIPVARPSADCVNVSNWLDQ